ncbi:hypothetical protein HOF92_14395 [bacterium]|nr:hypothetical protein [bacterium]
MKPIVQTCLTLFFLSLSHHHASRIDLRYAKGFQVSYSGDIKIVTVGNLRDPSEKPHSYILVPKDSGPLPPLPSGQVVRTPIRRAGSLSTTHLSHFVDLGLRRRLKAFSKLEYIQSPQLREMVEMGNIVATGFGMDEIREVGMKNELELILGFGPGEPETRFRSLVLSGIPVALNREYMDPHPLGYAEWIKFTALFFHQEALAERVFSTMEKKYLGWVKEAKNCTLHPKVLLNALHSGTWYLPGGNTYWPNLIKDAGGTYVLQKNNSTQGSLPYTFDEVYALGSDARFWLNSEGFSCSELAQKDKRYARFNSFKNKNVFNRNKKQSQGLPDDYYENGLSHPDVLLKDLVAIFHPEIRNREKLIWYRKVE